ncbi:MULTISPECIES: 2-amino-4-hydroxy-6-hydroxymethyldihydropteridine diphosphokinase [unclassified Brevibacterium]|uniref:2-amino-4-hydroxy-6- hydroxymethyldihydropteridine diphosphokinase n=1 Tax=unclassified Brevibacterium TaxID=2614124 RepID=UPI0010F89E84|nr:MULTISPECIES: 2-amino-4-hydroxy-6-hydroxymethyldihydropteridine diphosphokinase [unclassified Brevibacterium]MCM1013617.1 2-amino-4-hydroxy-6-hydroxymethyldihydropteridine diphosphokinase [Brevibacterium sp. XM4083]
MSGQPDRIELRGLTVRGNHGVFDFEKREGQDFVVDVVLHTSTAAAAGTDDIADTIHYGDLAEAVAGIVEGTTFDLIETLAEAIADHCLTLTDHVEVVVHKPSAPIERTFADVTVTVDRHRGDAGSAEAPAAVAVLSLGANLGDAAATLDDAVAALDRHPAITVTKRSSLYRTAPWGGVEQNDFLNLGVLIETTLPVDQLLGVAQGIEVAAGRTRELRWGPRTLDIDLISVTTEAGALRTATPTLSLPHPRAHERAFVLVPWAETDPGAMVDTPTGSRPIAEVIAALDDQEITRVSSPQTPDI